MNLPERGCLASDFSRCIWKYDSFAIACANGWPYVFQCVGLKTVQVKELAARAVPQDKVEAIDVIESEEEHVIGLSDGPPDHGLCTWHSSKLTSVSFSNRFQLNQ